MKTFNGTAYFPNREAAEETMATLPPFAPSRFLSKTEINRGAGLAQVREFTRGFAIQLGNCGNYFPSTTADCQDRTNELNKTEFETKC